MATPPSQANETSYVHRSWFVYAFLIVLRIYACFINGYIHPDEFFQGGQELFFGREDKVLPWEFDPEHALRSIVPPTFMTYFPLWIVSLVRGTLNGWLILVVPRLFMCVCSFLSFDRILWKLYSSEHQTLTFVPSEILLLSSSWAVIVFCCRPFTNTLEAMILACLIDVCCLPSQNQKTDRTELFQQGFLIGIFSSVGAFTRFTFFFFATPILVLSLFSFPNENDFIRIRPKIGAISKLNGIITGFLVVTASFVLCDTYYYKTLVLSPLNALLYNSKVGNLSEHGLHPRITHALVNMPMLFGPLAILFILNINSTTTLVKVKRNVSSLSACIVLSLSVLSAAPHQEPRFLLPLIFPLVLLHSNTVFSNKYLLSLWIFLNAILFIFFGFFHQAGVVPSLLGLTDVAFNTDRSEFHLIYFHTYMPPSFLDKTNKITDLKGANSEELMTVLKRNVNCDNPNNVFVISSPSALMSNMSKDEACKRSNDMDFDRFSFKSAETFFHLSTEDFPTWCDDPFRFWSSFHLIRYKISCYL